MTFSKTIVGGTFDHFHKGHEAILETACDLSGSIIVGITGDEFAEKFRTGQIEPFQIRKQKVEKFLDSLGTRYSIVEINDFYGPSTTEKGLDAIVVSEETSLRAKEINAVRVKKGLKKMSIVEVPYVLAEDGKPISSERIRRGEIDEEGKKRSR